MDDEEVETGNGGARGENPAARFADVVGEAHVRKVDGVGGWIVEFDPIGRGAVGLGGVDVMSQDFVDDDLSAGAGGRGIGRAGCRGGEENVVGAAVGPEPERWSSRKKVA